MSIEFKSKYEEIKDLVWKYGNACIEFGDYQSERNDNAVREAENILLNEIHKMIEKC